MIDEQLAEQAATVFAHVTSGKWGRPYTEIQDDGKVLLLLVDVPASNTNEVDSQVRATVAEALNAIIPSRPEQLIGNWLVVFCRDGHVYESVLPDGL